MARVLNILFLLAMVGILGGCKEPEQTEAVWEGVKITDLRPSTGTVTDGKLKTINVDVYIFDMPASNADRLDDIWKMLSTQPVTFNDADAFAANFFSVGFGQVDTWNTIANLLRAGQAEKLEQISLLLFESQAEEVVIHRIKQKGTIFYVPASGSTEQVKVKPGKIALQVKAEAVPGAKGFFQLDAQPAFLVKVRNVLSPLDTLEKADSVFFKSLGFSVKMSPGDFFLLGPKEHRAEQVTLDGLFFSRAKPKKIIRTYLFVCRNMSF